MGATSPHREQLGAQSIIVVDWAFSLIAVVKRLIRGLEFSFAQTSSDQLNKTTHFRECEKLSNFRFTCI
jgi:hypothetical protein